MSLKTHPVFRSVVAFAAAVACLLGTAGAAHAAPSPPYHLQYDIPSLRGNIDTRKVTWNQSRGLTAWVRYPQGYDDQPDRAWPVLYLLHGWEDSAYAWLDKKKGNLDSVIPRDFPGLVVMPEGGKEWYMNWANAQKTPGHQWGDYLLEEVLPAMERKLRILPGRQNHAIGGLSMGGFGAIRAVQALPSYFGQLLSFSALIDTQDTTFAVLLDLAMVGRSPFGFSAVFGSPLGEYANSVNPLMNARDFVGSRVSLYYGTPPFAVFSGWDIRAKALGILEAADNLAAQKFGWALRGKGADVFQYDLDNASHDWPWWKKFLANAVARGIWEAPPIIQTSQATKWAYDTMQLHGNAWGVGYRFAARPTRKLTLFRDGQVLKGSGGPGAIRISAGAADADASGNGRPECTYELTIPFTQVLPAGC